jgi:small subunit ribosomal protein S18
MPPREPRRRAANDTGRKIKKKVCVFCRDRVEWVDYKDVNLLRRFMSDRGKIRARRVTGNCAQHQREVAVAIKTAREVALLPYTQRTVSEGRGPRSGGGGGRGPRPGPGVEAVEETPDEVEADVELDIAADADAGEEDEAEVELELEEVE